MQRFQLPLRHLLVLGLVFGLGLLLWKACDRVPLPFEAHIEPTSLGVEAGVSARQTLRVWVSVAEDAQVYYFAQGPSGVRFLGMDAPSTASIRDGRVLRSFTRALVQDDTPTGDGLTHVFLLASRTPLTHPPEVVAADANTDLRAQGACSSPPCAPASSEAVLRALKTATKAQDPEQQRWLEWHLPVDPPAPSRE